MNWSRAKTILIIALVITNVFLLSVYHKNAKADADRIAESTASAIEYLESRGIEIDCEVPKNIETMPVITLSFSQGDKGGGLYTSTVEGYPLEIIGLSDGKYINYAEKSDVDLDTLPAYTALLKSVGSITGRVTDLQLIYLIDRSDYVGQAGQDTALPYWKLSSGENSYYYSAFSE